MISIVVAVYNEAELIASCLAKLASVSRGRDCEILVCDGESSDRTVAIAEQMATVIRAPKGRGAQMNAAARRARGDVLFFVHVDMDMEPATLDAINQAIPENGFDGGGFSNVFSSHNHRIKMLGRILNPRFRDNDTSGNLIFFGDNGIFCRRSVFDSLGGFGEIPIMEDYDFSKRMAREFRVVRIREPRLIVSPRRHVRSGFLKTRLQWILIRRAYEAGVSPWLLKKWYRDPR